MATLTLIQNVPGSIVLYLQNLDGTPAEGLLYTDILVDLKKSTDANFANRPILTGEFTDLSGGFYSLILSETDLAVLGNLYIKVLGATIRTVLEPVLVVSSIPATPPTIVLPDTSIVFGTIVNADGTPASGVSIQARTLNVPSIFGGVAITTSLISVRADTFGQFNLVLVAGAQVDIIIPSVNYRRTITVPVDSSNLFTI